MFYPIFFEWRDYSYYASSDLHHNDQNYILYLACLILFSVLKFIVINLFPNLQLFASSQIFLNSGVRDNL